MPLWSAEIYPNSLETSAPIVGNSHPNMSRMDSLKD